MQLTFETLSEAKPGPVLGRNVERFWPDYRRWFLAGGGAQSASPDEALAALRRHMPELEETFARILDLGPDDPLFARFLTLYRPPAFIGACSIAATEQNGRPCLLRSYDFDPALCEGMILESAWRGRKVLGMADCLWGLVDGLNQDGLAVALTFGGRRETGDGFGIPLILRYLLEAARDVEDGIQVLRAVPSHMAYNVGLVDRSGRHAMVHLAPGGGAVVTDEAALTNHQDRIYWPAQARFTATVERKEHLCRLLDARDRDHDLAAAFLEPPVYRTRYGAGFGTLYTAILDPASATATYRWPGDELACTLGAFERHRLTVEYVEGQGARTRCATPVRPFRGEAHVQDRVEYACVQDPFEAALDGILRGLGAAGGQADPALLADLRSNPTPPWARLGELFHRRA